MSLIDTYSGVSKSRSKTKDCGVNRCNFQAKKSYLGSDSFPGITFMSSIGKTVSLITTVSVFILVVLSGTFILALKVITTVPLNII